MRCCLVQPRPAIKRRFFSPTSAFDPTQPRQTIAKRRFFQARPLLLTRHNYCGPARCLSSLEPGAWIQSSVEPMKYIMSTDAL